MGATGTAADQISETVLNGFAQLLRELGHGGRPVHVSQRTEAVFVLSGDAIQLEAYAAVPEAFAGVQVVRKLIEHVTAAEAAVLCQTLRQLRCCKPADAPLETASPITEDQDDRQCRCTDQ